MGACPVSSPVAQDALEMLTAAGLKPLRVYVVEPDTICYVNVRYQARTAYIKAKGLGAVVIEAAVDGWPI